MKKLVSEKFIYIASKWLSLHWYQGEGVGGVRKKAASMKFSLFLPCSVEAIETIVKDIVRLPAKMEA